MKAQVMILTVFLALSGAALSQQPNCFGSDAFKTCIDASSGNTYQIQKFGNNTFVNGTNSSTGNTWNQQTTKIGESMNIHQGTAADGKSWNITEQTYGEMKFINGQDSKGNSVNCVVTQYSNSCSK